MKKNKFLFLIFIILAPCFILWGCGTQLESLSFPQKNKTILVDETFGLYVNSQPEMDNLNVTYSILDETIATILSDGITVKGIKEGQTKIYATANGKSTEMTLTVIRNRTKLSTPTGLSFSDTTLSWTSVPNAKTYEVTITKGTQAKTYQTESNSLNFKAFDINYEEYASYEFSVIAKPEEGSIYFTNSNSSEIKTFKQIFSVSNLAYADNKISFNYNLNAVNLVETGSISFILQVLKDENYIVNTRIASSYLTNNKISYNFNPSEIGDYTVKVYVDSEKMVDSNIQQISVVKLSSPRISTDGTTIFVDGNSSDFFKYFKVENKTDVEISYDELVVSNLSSGEKNVFKTYSYRQNTENCFYINSAVSTLTIEKLETPSSVKLEKSVEEKSAVKIIWDAEYAIEDYQIYVNDKLTNISNHVEENGRHIATLNVFQESKIYSIYIISNKEKIDSVYYIESEKSSEMTVVKLAKPEIHYNELSNSFDFVFAQINLGSTFSFTARYEGVDYSLRNENIDALEKNINLAVLDLQSGLCETSITVERISTDTILYLSDEYLFSIKKLETPILNKSLINNKLKISWADVTDAQMYFVQVKNLTNNTIVTYSGTSINESNGIVSIEISGLENGKNYTISVQALSSSNETMQFLGSNISTLTVHKLSAPILSVLEKELNTITYQWSAVDGADSYDIYIDGNKISNTTNLFYQISSFGAGLHSISVIATSEEEDTVPSNVENNINSSNFYILNSPTGLTYAKNGDNAVISFSQVDYATTYKLLIVDTQNVVHQFDEFSLNGGKVYFTFLASTIFNLEGSYHINAYAFSEQNNIVENNPGYKALKMLKPVTAINLDLDNLYINWQTSDAEASNYKIYIDSVLVTDFNFLDDQGNRQTKYYIGNLDSGTYNITIISQGDNVSFIDSLPFTAQISKKENIEIPTISGFRAVSTDINSQFELVFNEVENAIYYKIYIVLENGNVVKTIQVQSQGATSITQLISREDFISGEKQYLFVRAFANPSSQVYSNSNIPSLSDLSRVVKISKLSEPAKIEIEEDGLNLQGLQAVINGDSISNSIYSIPHLSDGQTLEFIVRTIEGTTDGYFNDTFYMASNWVSFNMTKVDSPNINLYERSIEWSNLDSLNIKDYKIIIDFYGLGDVVIKSIGRNAEYITSLLDMDLSFDEIKNLILQSEESKLINYVGKYKIYIIAQAVDQNQQNIYISSDYSELEFIITETLTNDLIISEILEKEIQLTIDKNDALFMSEIELQIIQGANSAILRLGFEMGEIVENSLGEFIQNFYTISSDENNLYLRIYIQNILQNQPFTINWKAIGKQDYTRTASGYSVLNSTKLTTPILKYSNNENGNYILIDETVLATYVEGVIIYAKYGTQEMAFTNGTLLIPSDWENVSNIFVYAVKNGMISSDKAETTGLQTYSPVANVRLENNKVLDITSLIWEATSLESSWLVYIYYDNSVLKSINITTSCKLDLTSDLLREAGRYTFKIVAYGNNLTHFSSQGIEFSATKLSSALLELTNSGGILNWNLNAEYATQISEFILKIDNVKKSFAKDIRNDSLEEYSGMLPIQMKLVGNVAENIISSDYSAVANFYKHNLPETFSVNSGQFYFGEESNVNENLYRIKIGTQIYSYREQFGFNPISYFDIFDDGQNNKAYGFVAGGKVQIIDGITALTLNSNKKEITFNRLEVNSLEEEGYLIQSVVDGNEVITSFKFEWNEIGDVSSRTARVYIKPIGDVSATDLTRLGWNRKVKANGYLEYYYKEAEISYLVIGGKTEFILSQILPIDLASGDYEIYVQKSDSSLVSGFLDSKLDKVITFRQLATPILKLQNGKLNWGNIPSASSYALFYDGDKEGAVYLQNVSSYELGVDFSDLEKSNLYNFKMIAIGNVPTTKTLYSKNYVYTVSGKISNEIENLIKPRTAGNLTLSGGGFVWAESYKTFVSSGAQLEFVFYNLNNVEVTRGVVSASAFATKYPSLQILLEDELSECKEYLKAGERYKIKYRELGYELYFNSDYKELINNLSSREFVFAPTISNIYVEDNVLKWTTPSLVSAELGTIYYDIFFQTEASRIHATTITSTISTSVNSIDFSEIQELSSFKNNIESITGIFIVIRGNSEKYISGFNSRVIEVKAINGGTGLSLSEAGNLTWAEVDGVSCYEIEARVENNDIIIYKIYKYNGKFFLDKKLNGIELFTAQEIATVTISESKWTWNWAEDENVEAGLKYDLRIRYIPEEESGIYSIPGKFSNVAFSVYKLGLPNVQIVNGSLSWTSIQNANSYNVWVKYLNENGEQIGEIIQFSTTTNTFNLDIANRNQTMIQVAVQAIGPQQSINGIYYISTNIVYREFQYKANTVKDFIRDADIISWGDDVQGNSYEVVVYDTINGTYASYETSNKSYNLSLLKLSYLSEYKVMVKIKGNNETINSTSSTALTFKVLPTIENLKTNSGYITWKENLNKTDYKISIDSSYKGYQYIYIVGLDETGERYQVKSLTRNGIAISCVSEITVDGNGNIYFLPLELEENYSATVYVTAIGKQIGQLYYVGSADERLASSVIRYTSSTLNLTYNESTSTFTWASVLGYYEIELINNSTGEKIEIDKNTQITSTSYQHTLTTGSYTFRLRRYAKDVNSNILKSNYVSIEIEVE